MLSKLAQTLRVFARNRPTARELARGRRRRFDAVECILPSRVVSGESHAATVHVWDEYERLLGDFAGTFDVESTDPEASFPDQISFRERDGPVQSLRDVQFETPGIHYLTLTPVGDVGGGGSGTSDGPARFVSNPVQVFDEEPADRLYWGDIHLHSKLSDGAGTMEKGLAWGRDVMDLDVAAYTDHDTMGFFIPPQLQRRRMRRRYFEEMKMTTQRFHDPGDYVTLFGYEWTKQPNQGGHINVYFDCVDEAELVDSLDPEANRYEKLWRRLREWKDETGRDVLTIPHHTAEEMYPFDFSAVDYDDEMAPLVEVYSQWGNSELPGDADNPKPIEMGQGEIETPGHYVQDALELGNRVGLMGGSDFHGPRPGRSNIHLPPHFPTLDDLLEDGIGWGHIWRVWKEGSYAGGLTGFYAPELSRESIFESLRSRRVYATSQPHRILVEFAVDGTAVGEDDSTVVLDEADAERSISYRVAGTAPLARVTVVKNNENWHVESGTADTTAALETFTAEGTVTDDDPVTGMAWDESGAATDDERGTDADVYYLRVEQADDGMAWAGPIWVEAGDA